jgi:hypothetical protein
MLEFAEIRLSDKELFRGYFEKFPPSTSELTFTNLFCWRESKDHEFTVFENHLIISFFAEGLRRFYQPIGEGPADEIKSLVKLFPGSSFERVEKGIAEQMIGIKAIATPEQNDYIYNVYDMQNLPGDKYSQKRNFVKRFSNYTPSICELDEDTANEFLEMQQRWCDMRNCRADKSASAEDYAVREALSNFRRLGIVGVCVRINGRIEGFAVGEPLNKDTYVEHFEKGNTEFTGIYQYLLKEFAMQIPSEFKFLNREQDLGVEGLRKAKLSYHPAKMIEKFSIG